MRAVSTPWLIFLPLALMFACSGNDADEVGVGTECSASTPCPDDDDDETPALQCLDQFTGGYCGLSDCESNDDCPTGSGCVAHTDGANYCFRLCDDKDECNANRSEDVEANCSANIEFADGSTSSKACVPPSGG